MISAEEALALTYNTIKPVSFEDIEKAIISSAKDGDKETHIMMSINQASMLEKLGYKVTNAETDDPEDYNPNYSEFLVSWRT